MDNRGLIMAAMAMATIAATPAMATPVVRVVREPRQVTTCSSKSEHAWTHCEWCGGKIGYQRTYKWDVYEREWVETTQNVPPLCRTCKSKHKTREKLAREEASLDRKLEEKETRARIAAKRQALRNWTSEH